MAQIQQTPSDADDTASPRLPTATRECRAGRRSSRGSNAPRRRDRCELQRLSDELTESSSGLHDFFSDFASTALHNEQRTDDSCPARRVFDIPEVLEQMLSYLDTIELLRAMEVDRTMYQAIESSPLLQERLFLRPVADAHLKVPFLASLSRLRERGLKRGTPSPSPGFPLFTCRASPDASTRLAGIMAKFSRELPRIGKRCRAMLVCQPPIHTMGVYALCCSHNPYSFGAGNGMTPTAAPKSFAVEMMGPSEVPEPPFEIITSKRGITVGDLYDMTVQTRKLHDRCPWAPPSEHNDQGDVFAAVSFGGAVELQPDDPAIAGGPFANIGGILPPEIPTDIDLYSSTRPVELLERYTAVKRRGK